MRTDPILNNAKVGLLLLEKVVFTRTGRTKKARSSMNRVWHYGQNLSENVCLFHENQFPGLHIGSRLHPAQVDPARNAGGFPLDSKYSSGPIPRNQCFNFLAQKIIDFHCYV